MMAASCVSMMLVVGAAAQTPPTLPTMWTAETVDPPQGDGIEAYNFVAKPSEENPSTMWSNYSGCQRLIRVGTQVDAGRYLLGCDAVDCCKEAQEGNQLEFQIPDVHPKELAKVNYLGKQTITNFGEKVEADAWEWKFLIKKTTAYTQPCSTCANNVTLVQWVVNTAQVNATIQFKNFKGIAEGTPEAAAFKQTFAVPEVCKGNIVNCDDARAQGLLRKDRKF